MPQKKIDFSQMPDYRVPSTGTVSGTGKIDFSQMPDFTQSVPVPNPAAAVSAPIQVNPYASPTKGVPIGTPIVKAENAPPDANILRPLGAGIVRGATGLAPGGFIGAGVGAGGELLAQTIEDRPEYNWGQ